MPRAGKTTLSSKYKCKVFHRDYIQPSQIVRSLNDFEDFVVEGVFANAYERKKIINGYNGNYKKCIYLNIPLEIRKHRECWTKYCEYFNFQEPTLEEGWDEIVIITPEKEEHI